MKNKAETAPKFERAPRLVDQVTKFLNDRIDSKTYAVGDKLPPESAMADQLGVSRTVIREAVSRLIYDGILEARQGSGIIVADSGQKTTFRLGPFEDSNATDSKYLLELRAILEGEAASLAARRRSAEHLEMLRKCVERIKKCPLASEQAVVEDIRFHELITEASCNPYLLDFMTFFRNRLKHLFLKTHGLHKIREDPEWTVNAHSQILQAIVNKDSEGARKAAIQHLQVAATGLNIKLFE